MLRLSVMLVAAVFVFCSCSTTTDKPAAQAPAGAAKAFEMQEVGNIQIGGPVSHRNLTVFPLYLKAFKETDKDYITLGEALEEKKLELKEKGEREEVNAIEISNNCERPVYILAGQIIMGGKQDRVITKDTVLPPGEKLVVEVCCVEHGRWSPRNILSGESKQIFGGYASGNVTVTIREMTQSGGQLSQSGVWEEVEKELKSSGGLTPTQTYKGVLDAREKMIDEYIKALKSFEKDEKICGFVECVNGSVYSCDLFASPKLLAMFRMFQLRCYALDALNAGKPEEKKEVTFEQVKDFLAKIEAARANGEELDKNEHRRVEKVESEKVIGFGNAVIDLGRWEELHMNAYSKDK